MLSPMWRISNPSLELSLSCLSQEPFPLIVVSHVVPSNGAAQVCGLWNSPGLSPVLVRSPVPPRAGSHGLTHPPHATACITTAKLGIKVCSYFTLEGSPSNISPDFVSGGSPQTPGLASLVVV